VQNKPQRPRLFRAARRFRRKTVAVVAASVSMLAMTKLQPTSASS